jgi:predicted acylesterase/phospholipase RssA/ankyrin repeat protein
MQYGPRELYDDIQDILNSGKVSESKVLDVLRHQQDNFFSDMSFNEDRPLPLKYQGKQINLLHLASMCGWPKLISYVINDEESPLKFNQKQAQQKDSAGNTPLGYARNGSNSNVARILVEKFGSLDATYAASSATREQPLVEFLSFDELVEHRESLYDPIVSAMDSQAPNLTALLAQVESLAENPDADKAPMPPIRYLCAQGGGAKGAAYTGTVRAMERTGVLQDLEVVAGASAGAINAFMMGLGLNATQVETMIHNLNFLDLNDYSDRWLTWAKKELGHSGENFHNWACAMMGQITGEDPLKMTFASYAQLCKENPALKKMIFKGTNLDKNGVEQTFSAEQTPDVLIVDAVRASMSFPGAFAPWEVREYKDGQLRKFGTFIDGGVRCNFPIGVFNDKIYEDPHYPRVDTRQGDSSDVIPRNPCSVGLSLCNIQQLNSEVTPLDSRLHAMQLQIMDKNAEPSVEEELNGKNSRWTYTQFASALATHLVGLNPEDVQAKYKAYQDQTVQIYTEGVGTLEFSLSAARQKLIEDSGDKAWMQWHQHKQNPTLTYNGARFDMDFFPKDNEGRFIARPSKEEQTKHFTAILENYFSNIQSEASNKQRHQSPQDSGPQNNQKLKFYSNQIQNVIEFCKREDLDVTEILTDAFLSAVSKKADKLKKAQEHAVKVNQIVDEDLALNQIASLIKSGKNQEALQLFKGKLSYIFKYIEKSQGEILGLAAQSGDPDLLLGMLKMLSTTQKMLGQTGRKNRYGLTQLLNEASPVSLYAYAMNSPDSKTMLDILLQNHIDPLKVDANNKNAFHYAIDKGDLHTLNALINWYVSTRRQNPREALFGIPASTLGHYLVEKGSKEALQAINKEPKILDHLISPTAVDDNGVTCLQLASNLFYNGSAQGQADALNDADTLEAQRIICASYGKPSQDLAALAKLNNVSYNDAIKQRAIEKEKIHAIKQGLIQGDPIPEDAGLCLKLLESTDETGLNFLCQCAKDPRLSMVAKQLITKVYYYSTGYRVYATYPYSAAVKSLIDGKVQGKSPLYYAAENNNKDMITTLRSYDADVNGAGPLDNPSALTAAAKRDACDAVQELIVSKPQIALVGGYKSIARRTIDDQGKTGLHYLARSQSDDAGIAMYTFLKGGRGIVSNVGSASFPDVSNITDLQGRTAFSYLLENPRAIEILKVLVVKGGGTLGSLSTWKLDDYFNFTEKRSNGYTDLELAYKINPKLAEYIAQNIKDVNLAQAAKEKIRAEQIYEGIIEKTIDVEDEFEFVDVGRESEQENIKQVAPQVNRGLPLIHSFRESVKSPIQPTTSSKQTVQEGPDYETVYDTLDAYITALKNYVGRFMFSNPRKDTTDLLAALEKLRENLTDINHVVIEQTMRETIAQSGIGGGTKGALAEADKELLGRKKPHQRQGK